MSDFLRCCVVVLFGVLIILTLMFAQWLSANGPEWMMYAGGKHLGLGSFSAIFVLISVEAFIGNVVFSRIK